ncbi:MAG: Holliday junction branch migration protein RuvA [Kiritimatiellae bacterium]|nr:Holliday junction branch migration protein RuvA [Kiritimatiellia bacterium]
MIATLHGTLYSKQPSAVIIEAGGVGYEVLIPLSTYDRLPATGGECRLLVSHIVREDDELLFGFATSEEKQVFNLLLTISGIGPKLGLCVLSGLNVADLKRCVVESDIKRLSSVRGIGRKTAERIVVELRDKIDPVEGMSLRTAPGAPPAAETVLRDTMMGLMALGYAQDQARKMVQAALDGGADAGNAEALIKRALAGR